MFISEILGEKHAKAAQKRKNKKVNKAYDVLKNEVAVVFQKQFLVDDEGNTYMREVPVAIGRRVTDDPTGQLTPPEQIKKQSKGIAVHIEHYLLDELWNVGNQKINISEECKQVMIRRADGTVPTQTQEEVKEEVKQEEPTTENTVASSNADQAATEENIQPAAEENKGEAEEDKEEEGPTLSPAEMDDLIKRNFIMCLVRHVKDSDLPLEPSLLQGEYMHRYEHKDMGKIDFKQSNYKKITKFLKKMKQAKLISFDKMKGVDHELILGINRKGKFGNSLN